MAYFQAMKLEAEKQELQGKLDDAVKEIERSKKVCFSILCICTKWPCSHLSVNSITE